MSLDVLCQWRPCMTTYIVRIPPIRKKHTDRVFLSSACETLDQGVFLLRDCELLDQ